MLWGGHLPGSCPAGVQSTSIHVAHFSPQECDWTVTDVIIVVEGSLKFVEGLQTCFLNDYDATHHLAGHKTVHRSTESVHQTPTSVLAVMFVMAGNRAGQHCKIFRVPAHQRAATAGVHSGGCQESPAAGIYRASKRVCGRGRDFKACASAAPEHRYCPSQSAGERGECKVPRYSLPWQSSSPIMIGVLPTVTVHCTPALLDHMHVFPTVWAKH